MDYMHELWSWISQRSPWFYISLLLACANLKVLPFAWFIRILKGYLQYHHFDQRPVHRGEPESPTLFQPTIFTTYAPLGEIDHFLHKSNSTYMTDLDVARGQHIYSLCRIGIQKYSALSSRKGPFMPILGGINFSFRREIRPYRKYEIWTRVLTWDDKWLYLVSHFVKPGTKMPERYEDQPWRTLKRVPKKTKSQKEGKEDSKQPSGVDVISGLYATAVSKYVFKQGRRTITPMLVFESAGLMPVSSTGFKETPKADLIFSQAVGGRCGEGAAIAESFSELEKPHAWLNGNDNVAFARY